MKAISNSRWAATDLIAAVLDNHQQLDQALLKIFAVGSRHHQLDQRDRAFSRLLATTVLRRLGQIDYAIDSLLERPLAARLKRVRNVLRLGAAQLLFLGTPAHAAVNQTVQLVGYKSPFKGLINAVLRRISDQPEGLIELGDKCWLNTPDWLWDSWQAEYGDDKTRAIVEAHLSEPPLDITVKGATRAWAKRLKANILPTGTLRRIDGGAIPDLSGYHDGQWWIQDVASAIPANIIIASFKNGIGGTKVLDACAAPGGKSAQLANAGAQVVALDISIQRVKKLQENLKRLKLNIKVLNKDFLKWAPNKPYSAILLDAPCTGTGTIRRHPDIPFLRNPKDVARLTGLQATLLDAAVKILDSDGVLVYCTCSLQPEEGRLQIEKLLARDRSIERWPIEEHFFAGMEAERSSGGDIQILPSSFSNEGGADGFFISRIKRRA